MRFGIEDASVDCMLVMRLRARRRVCRRGERGKFERVLMSLSVKSMASWSYSKNSISPALLPCFFLGERGGGRGNGLWQRPGSQSRESCGLWFPKR